MVVHRIGFFYLFVICYAKRHPANIYSFLLADNLILFLTLFLGKGCEAQKNEDLETTVVEYVANTRGFYKKIVVQNKTITVSKDRRGDDNPTPVKTADADWQKIIEAFQKVGVTRFGVGKSFIHIDMGDVLNPKIWVPYARWTYTY